jgi:hypothetical protein
MNTRLQLLLTLSIILVFSLSSCKKDDNNNNNTDGPMLRFKYVLDPTQQRLGNLGTPAAMPANHAGQNPQFNGISAHYVELAPTQFTLLGAGTVLFMNDETTAGGSKAIVFNKEIIKNNGEVFLEVPIKDVTPGSYEWLRVSLAYQNYNVQFDALGSTFTGTLASFVGYNTYVESYKIKDSTVVVNSNKAQGYWGFETIYTVNTGQAPATTVPNPIQATSPIPLNSCVVTGGFAQPFVITGSETEDVTILVSLSTNKSFEWEDLNGDDTWDPLDGENVVDMGLRGLEPRVE